MKYVVHYFFLVFLRLFPYKFLTVWQFGFTIHNDTLTYLGSFYFAERLLPRSWWRAMQNNREANKTLLRLHFTKMWRETYSAYKYIYMDLWLTSDRGPWIYQSESAKSFIFKIHHDSCWCCYLILWGVIKRVIFCLGWTIISYKNYCKFIVCIVEAILLLMLSLAGSDKSRWRERAASTLDTIDSVGIRLGVTECFSP